MTLHLLFEGGARQLAIFPGAILDVDSIEDRGSMGVPFCSITVRFA
jgi:hypothetical protein